MFTIIIIIIIIIIFIDSFHKPDWNGRYSTIIEDIR